MPEDQPDSTNPLISSIAYTPAVKAAQEQRGSRRVYAKMEARGEERPWQDAVTPELAEFIAQQDTLYLGTANAHGQPYVQHRGGPKGFLKVLDDHTLGMADFPGNAQYISIGNLNDNDKAFIFLMDYPHRHRIKPGFPFCLPRMAPLYTRGPPSARNSVHRTIVQLQRPSPQPALTCDRLEPLLSGHSSDTAPHLCPFFVRRASLHSPRVSLPGPVAPRSSAACRRTAAGSDALPPAGASSTSRASPAGLRFSPAAAASSSATSA